MRNNATADRQAPRLGLIGSLAFHAGIISVMFFTWTHKLDIADQSAPVVPVDLVTFAEKTNIAPMVAAEPKLPPPADQLTAPPLPAPMLPPKFEVAPAEKPAPVPNPAPKKETFDINNIMAMLNKHQVAAPRNARIGARNVQGIGAQNAMTADLRTLLQSEIYRCWSPPVGAPHPEKLIVAYELFLNRDGSVAQPPQLTADSSSAAAGDPYMRAAAEAARRAIYTCAPYKLPAERYNQWHDVTFVFDPRDMEQ
ncbi:MAG: hypothetical protein KGM97_06345 [Alphaproteobacteria bacterium]|nr:hypothetical protein [Alphaproteobacteria bacterium]MDE2630594.1 hypothetical protein [Alphaproteobacteria bacterium]